MSQEILNVFQDEIPASRAWCNEINSNFSSFTREINLTFKLN